MGLARGKLNVNDVAEGRCPLLGPATYVWVQGCARRCPGCFNVSALDLGRPATVLSTAELARRVLRSGRDALVLSGGEPFEQATGLAALCRAVRQVRPGVRILCYTGYELEELAVGGPGWHELLRELDVLVDGPFDRDRLTDSPLAGSSNQRVLLLGSRVEPEEVAAVRRLQVEVQYDRHGRLRMIGTGAGDVDMNALVRRLRENGVVLKAVDP